MDSNPPPPQTYLDNIDVLAHLNLLIRVPGSVERTYRRSIGGILRFIFLASEGYSVFYGPVDANTGSNLYTFKVLRMPSGPFPLYEVMFPEVKMLGIPWGSTEDQLLSNLVRNRNDSKYNL
jgi:hypothetical protein